MVAHEPPDVASCAVVSPDPADLDVRLVRRRDRFAAQRLLSRLSTIKAVRGCGVRWLAGIDAVGVRVTTGKDGRRVGLAGLRTCGSVWVCPVCSAKILAHRQDEITRAASAWRSRDVGGRIAFFTFTVRHDASMSIDTVWDAISAGQHAITAGRAHQLEKVAHGIWSDEIVETCDVDACGAVYDCDAAVHRHPDLVDEVYGCDVKCCTDDTDKGRAHRLRCRAGQTTARALRAREHLAGCRIGQPTDRALAHAPLCRIGEPTSALLPWLRVVEVTTGDNGWHVHQHMAVFLPAGTTDGQRDALYDAWHERWVRGAAEAGCDGSRKVNHATWATDDAAGLSDYMTKATYSGPQRLGLELARGDLKAARFGNRGTFALLADVVANRDPADVARWHAFEAGSRGRRQMTWSHGTRAYFAALGAFAEEEKQDEDIAAVETGTVDDTRAWLPYKSWSWVLGAPGRKADLYDAFERSDVEGWAWLDRHGVFFQRVRQEADGPSTSGDGPPADD